MPFSALWFIAGLIAFNTLNFKLILYILFGFVLSVTFCSRAGAQTNKPTAADSLRAARAYMATKHYKDSVTKARTAKTKSLQKARQARLDSIKDARQATNKVALDKRKVITDSVKAKQKERTDKAEAIKKYKGSKRFADSVTIVKRNRTDAIKKTIKKHNDSLAAIRRHTLDSATRVRKHFTDSVKVARTKSLDSLKSIRKRRLDSLANAKKVKGKTIAAKDKTTDQKKKLALEIKMKQKHEAYTNQTMLKKKWTPFRSFTQNAFTHYNYYYNANRKMEEANANMLRAGPKENYDSLIKIYPFDPDRDSMMMAADMDSIIRKASVGIQVHDPRVKWANDLYLLMGQAYYYKGNYNNAAATFKYIISVDEEAKKKEKGATQLVQEEKGGIFAHKSVHNDAILWLARTLVQAKQVENGQAVLSLLAGDAKLPEDLVGEVAVGKAFAYYTDGNYSATSDQLAIAMEDQYLPDWLRMRAAFLHGQLQQNDAHYKEAALSFERCLDFFPKLDMDFMARKNIAYNTLMAGGDVEGGMKPLKNVLNDAKYANYHDQVYYVLGRLAAKAKKPDDAIRYLKQSAAVPKATKKQKSLSFVALGDVYYDLARYTDAKMAYDSAAKYAGTSKDEVIIAAAQRSKGLSEISQPSDIIHDQDSLLALAAMSKKEQLAVVRDYLRDLEKKLKDSIKNAAEGSVAPIPTVETSADPQDAAANWYFSSPTIMQQGAADFKRKWGNRALKDDWRRAAALGPGGATDGAGNGAIAETETEDEDTKVDTKSGLPSEASLLAKIPDTKAKQDAAVRAIQKAYIAMAKAYMKQLDDHVQATKTLDTLDKRFPDHNQKEEELYLRYQIAIRENKLDKALAYSTELLAKFPDSKYAASLKPKDAKVSAANGGVAVAKYYEETYALIEAHKYDEALAHVSTGMKEYDDPVFRKRFQMAEAMAYAGKGDYDKSDTLTTRFIASNPGDSLVAWASSVADFVKDIRKTGKPSWYKEGPIARDTAKPLATTTTTEPVKPANMEPDEPPRPADVPYSYHYNATEEHVAIIVFPGLDSRTLKLKNKLRAFDDSLKTPGAHTVMLDMYGRNLAIAAVSKFANATAAKIYIDTLMADSVLKDYLPEELKVYIISASNYRKMFYDKDIDSYKEFYNTFYRKPD